MRYGFHCRAAPGFLPASRQAAPDGGSYCGGRAARRLRCDAHTRVASRNSLCSLRSRRSDNRDESVYEACCARRPKCCASRRHRNRPRRVPPAARKWRGWCSLRIPTTPLQSCAWLGRGAPLRRRGARAHGRARSALRHHSHRGCPSVESAANTASFAMRPCARAPQGSRHAVRPPQ